MPGVFGVPEGGTEVETIIRDQEGSRAGRILGYIAALLGTFVVLVGSALTVDLVNRHDPRAEIDALHAQAQQFRSDILGQRFALENAANSQRSDSRVLIDELNWTDAKYEDAERDKQALDLAFDGYQGTLDNIRALLVDASESFGLGGDSAHPDQSQMRAFFTYETLMLDKAGLFEDCLESRVDNMRNGHPSTGTSGGDDPDASAPEGEARSHELNVQCPAISDSNGVVLRNAFLLNEVALGALDDCETHFGRQLIEAARILNRSAVVNRSAADKLALYDRLSMEARKQRLWHGPQPEDWAQAEEDMQNACEPLRQFGAAP
jgi:hypothetical protein